MEMHGITWDIAELHSSVERMDSTIEDNWNYSSELVRWHKVVDVDMLEDLHSLLDVETYLALHHLEHRRNVDDRHEPTECCCKSQIDF